MIRLVEALIAFLSPVVDSDISPMLDDLCMSSVPPPPPLLFVFFYELLYNFCIFFLYNGKKENNLGIRTYL